MMKLDYDFKGDIEYYFQEAIKDAKKSNLGLYYYRGEVYLQNDFHSYYFINVTKYVYKNLYEVYTFGSWSDKTKLRHLVQLPFNKESFFKRG